MRKYEILEDAPPGGVPVPRFTWALASPCSAAIRYQVSLHPGVARTAISAATEKTMRLRMRVSSCSRVRRRRFTVRRPFVRCATSATQVSALSASASNAARSSFVMPKDSGHAAGTVALSALSWGVPSGFPV